MRNKANLGIHVSFLNVVVIIVSLFSSCAGETNIIDDNNNKLLCFSVSVPSWKSNDSISSSKDSRATPITDTSLGTSNTFNLIADENDGSSNYSTLIDNKPVSYSNNLWKTKTDYYWSGTSSKTINFYAYYSTSAINGILNHTAGSAPTLTYTVPDDAANQHDIIVATKSLTEDANSAVDLSFNHIFAAVKFYVGTSGMPPGTITKITLNNIQYTGTYSFGSSWTPNTTSLKSFSQTVSASNAANTIITSGATTFMMMPQTLNSNASITVTYSSGIVYTKVIAGTWSAGKTYIYNLSKAVNIGDYYFSDGTWGTIAEHTNSTAKPIAVIFSNTTSAKDKAYGFIHGYAMALQNAQNTGNFPWSTYTGTGTQIQNTICNTSALQIGNLDGYSESKNVLTKYGSNSISNLSSTFPAFYYAFSYGTSSIGGTVNAAPASSSGWFLPSTGQWYLIVKNLGGITAASSSTNHAHFLSTALSAAANINKYLDAVHTAINTITVHDIDFYTLNNTASIRFYWTSTEYSASCASSANFYYDDSFYLDTSGVPGPESGRRVRSVIAF